MTLFVFGFSRVTIKCSISIPMTPIRTEISCNSMHGNAIPMLPTGQTLVQKLEKIRPKYVKTVAIIRTSGKKQQNSIFPNLV